MTTAFQRSAFQDNAFQIDDTASGGKGDNAGGKESRHPSFKPTGLVDRPRKPVKEGRKEVSDRVDESRQIEAEIAGRLAKEFSEETLNIQQEPPPVAPVEEMTLAEVELEIGVLLRKKLRTQEDEILILLLMAAAAA